ncbi:MAG TPA: zinc ribbon domain-containing protein [Gaiellaceae bacterium]|nr:zinc ribbon domain-containing protein [Gaiellaceae bacterium]
MPIYEYRCPNGHTFELFQRMTDPQPSDCQICGAAPLEKVFHPVAVHFKGSGFYTTDYGRGRKRDGDGDGAGGGDSSDGKAKTDSKPEKKDKPKKKAAEA